MKLSGDQQAALLRIVRLLPETLHEDFWKYVASRMRPIVNIGDDVFQQIITDTFSRYRGERRNIQKEQV